MERWSVYVRIFRSRCFSRAPAKTDVQEFLEQFLVVIVRFLCRIGEVFILRDLGVGIGFEDVKLPVSRHPHVDARIAAESECAIYPFC